MENTIDNKQTTKTRKKNTTLCFFEALACVTIVFIHCPFPGDFGITMEGFARFGVPLFFVVSGFFMIKTGMQVKELRQKLKARAARVGFLLLFSFLIYLTLDAVGSCFGSSKIPFVTWLANTFHWKKIIILLVCNNPITTVINWFMIAMLFSFLIIYIFPEMFISNKWVPVILASLLVFWIIFRIIVITTGVTLFGVELSNGFLYRSWYANGLPFISLGIVLKRHEESMKKIPFIVVIPLLIFFMVAAPFEHLLIIKCLGFGLSYYFCNIASVIAIIVLCIKRVDLFSQSRLLNQEGNWTRFVYIFHPAIITVLGVVFRVLGLSDNKMIFWGKPIIVVFVAVFTAMLFNFILLKVKKIVFKKPVV